MACLSYAAQALWRLWYPEQAQQRCQDVLPSLGSSRIRSVWPLA
jgi:hypothetical protein